MCGITGVLNWGDRGLVAEMNRVQAHRGPDDQGIWDAMVDGVGYVGLASRRLAILDLSPLGHMPMASADGGAVITYNGEIYNCDVLREELKRFGHVFRSRSDTEVLLHSYLEWGPECVRRLNGMFAFALWDTKARRLFIARDHFGIKPLYYCVKPGGFAFASELKSLLCLPGISREIDYHAVHQYLSFLWVPEPATILREVRKLPPGHYAIVDTRGVQIKEYWDLEFPSLDHVFSRDEAALAEEVRRRFQKVVRAQMLSDVPVGAFLSAGMDSSSIVSAMAGASNKPVHTYTISFPEEHRRGGVVDDPGVAARTARHFGCEHTDITIKADTANLLPKLIWHMDEPVADPALITAYLINREARKNVTVLLSGIGGDEVFGGYRKYQAHYLAQRYQQIPRGLRQSVIEPLGRQMPTMFNTSLKDYVRFAKKMLRSGSLPPQERFIMDSVYFEEEEKLRLYSRELFDKTVGYDPRHRHLDCFAHVAESDFLNQMLYLDVKMFLPSLNLNYNDKMSMASSAEVRVPFLDPEFVQWVASNIAPDLKIKGATTKHILRQAMQPVLPPEVLIQAKAGFGAPVGHWLRAELRPMIAELLSADAIRRRGLFEPSYVSQLIREHYDGREDRAYALWQLLTLELWMREFVD